MVQVSGQQRLTGRGVSHHAAVQSYELVLATRLRQVLWSGGKEQDIYAIWKARMLQDAGIRYFHVAHPVCKVHRTLTAHF